MKQTGIIMSGDHPLKVLDGTKTMTRRVIKPQPIVAFYQGSVPQFQCTGFGKKPYSPGYDKHTLLQFCPYGQVGDRLWVRETFVLECDEDYQYEEFYSLVTDRPVKTIPPIDPDFSGYHLIPHYKATEPEPMICDDGEYTRWKPSIFMPRWASRITLEITELRAERLQEISEEDAEAEGVSWSPVGSGENPQIISAVENFADLWDSLNAKRGYGWNTNPWVWAIGFKLI